MKMKKKRQKIDGGKCRCGNKLPAVYEDETPYEFCSQKCADKYNKITKRRKL